MHVASKCRTVTMKRLVKYSKITNIATMLKSLKAGRKRRRIDEAIKF